MTLDIYTAEVSISPIKSGLGLHICQAWKLLIYLLGGLYHSCYCFDIPEDKTNIRIKEKS